MKYITIDALAVKVIAELKQRNFRIALVSNMMLPGKLLKAKLQEANILACFDNIAISSDVGFIKPHPEIFRRTLAQSKLCVDEVVFVGDTYQQDINGESKFCISLLEKKVLVIIISFHYPKEKFSREYSKRINVKYESIRSYNRLATLN